MDSIRAALHVPFVALIFGIFGFGGVSAALPLINGHTDAVLALSTAPASTAPAPDAPPPAVPAPNPIDIVSQTQRDQAHEDVGRARAVIRFAEWSVTGVDVGEGTLECLRGHESQFQDAMRAVDASLQSLDDVRRSIPNMANDELAVEFNVAGNADGVPWITEDGKTCRDHHDAIVGFLLKYPPSVFPNAIQGGVPGRCNEELALHRAISCFDQAAAPFSVFQFQLVRVVPRLSWATHSEKGEQYRRVDIVIRGQFVVPGGDVDRFEELVTESKGRLISS